ncbi:MAG: CBS domain-containing protein [Thermoanaerobaculia bacterium]
MKVRNVMKKEVKFCPPEATVAEVARVMAANECGVVPIVDAQKRVVGMVTDRDICLEVGTKDRLPSRVPVREIMKRKVYGCGPEEEIQAALRLMQNRKVRRLPVLDGDGKLCGILSIDDVVLYAEKTRGTKAPELSEMELVDTFKAITRKPARPQPIVQA